MRKLKKALSLFLAMTVMMLTVSLLNVSAGSVTYAESYAAAVDLSDYSDAQLSAVPMSVILDRLVYMGDPYGTFYGESQYDVKERSSFGEKITVDTGKTIKALFYLADWDDYRTVDENTVIDFTPALQYQTDYVRLILIIGSESQTDPNNKKYCANIYIKPNYYVDWDLGNLKFYYKDNDQKERLDLDSFSCGSFEGSYNSKRIIDETSEIYLEFNPLGVRNAGTGRIVDADLNVSTTYSQINGDEILLKGSGGKRSEIFTFDFRVTDGTTGSTEIRIDLDGECYYSVECNLKNESNKTPIDYEEKAPVTDPLSVDKRFVLKKGYSSDYTYNLRLIAVVYGDTCVDDDVVKIVSGDYATPEAAEAQPDIKDKLYDGTYSANFKDGSVFTIFLNDGTETVAVKLSINLTETDPNAPDPDERPTTFGSIVVHDENDEYVVEQSVVSGGFGYITIFVYKDDFDLTKVKLVTEGDDFLYIYNSSTGKIVDFTEPLFPQAFSFTA